jgi:hypothetical protein
VGRALVFLLVQAPLALLLTAGCAAVACVAALADRSGRTAREMAGAWSRVLLRLFRVGVQVSGLEHAPAGPAVYAANHASVFDILIARHPRASSSFTRRACPFARRGLMRRPAHPGHERRGLFRRHCSLTALSDASSAEARPRDRGGGIAPSRWSGEGGDGPEPFGRPGPGACTRRCRRRGAC